MKFFKFNKAKGWVALVIWIIMSYFCKLPFYPCRWSPVIREPIYKWGFCVPSVLMRRLIVGVHEMYFGFNYGWVLALVLNAVIAYVSACIIIWLYKRYKK